MIVVTGTGRCGTSLMMQTLYHLGVPTLGDPISDDYNTLKKWDLEGKLSEEITGMNPKGYWELPIDEIYKMVDAGFKNHKGKCIKIVGGAFLELSHEDIEFVILCHREDKTYQAKSMHKLAHLELCINEKYNVNNPYIEWYKDKDVWDILNYQEMVLFHIKTVLAEASIPVLEVVFEEMVTDPENKIKDLVKFLGIKNPNIARAINNVDIR